MATSPASLSPVTRVLSCIQPTGDVHLGNYLGALRNWVSGQHDCDGFHGIVDLHALTVTDQPDVIGKATLELAAMFFAVGLDPDVATVFVQSHVPEHSQMAWIMECNVSFGELSRMTQFKEKSCQARERVHLGRPVHLSRRCRLRTSCSTTRSRSPLARISASTSRSHATSRSGSTAASATPSWCHAPSPRKRAPESWTCRIPHRR